MPPSTGGSSYSRCSGSGVVQELRATNEKDPVPPTYLYHPLASRTCSIHQDHPACIYIEVIDGKVRGGVEGTKKNTHEVSRILKTI